MRFDSPNGPAAAGAGVDPAGVDPVLSVVVPVYGCGSCVEHLYERLTATLGGMGVGYEIVLVDDRAEDGSWPEIERLAAMDGAVRGILLSRNFGQHAAITAGLRYARGAWVAVMDCDLQDPPEDLPHLYAKAGEGYDIVFGRRMRKPTGFIRGLLGRLYFSGIRVFARSPIEGQYGTFSVISRKVVDAFLQFRDQDRHYLMILTWLRFDTATVDYQPARRYRGRSSYSLAKLLEHAFDGVFFQTTVLLRWIVYTGFGLAALGGLLALRVVYAKVVGTVFPGWTSLVAGGLFLGGFIILSTGITGLYIGKVFDQVRDRPVFVVDRVVESKASELARGERVAGGEQGERVAGGGQGEQVAGGTGDPARERGGQDRRNTSHTPLRGSRRLRARGMEEV